MMTIRSVLPLILQYTRIKIATILFGVFPYVSPAQAQHPPPPMDSLPLARAAAVRSIDITGNSRLPADSILAVISTREGEVIDSSIIERDNQAIIRLYASHGLFQAAASTSVSWSADSAEVEIKITVTEGPPAVIGQIDIEGNTAFSKDILMEGVESREGTVFSPEGLERDIERILRRYERAGFPFANVDIASIRTRRTDPGIIEMIVGLHISEEQRVTITEFRVSGNAETRNEVVVRELGIRIGDLYDQSRVEKVRRRLMRLGIFSSVGEPELSLTSTGAALTVSVVEGRTNTFDGIAGYVPAASIGEDGYVTGMITVSMKNLFGTGRKLHVMWERVDRESREFGLRYVEPWVFSLPVDVSGHFNQRKQDTSYVEQFVEARAQVRLSDVIGVGGMIANENVVPSTLLQFRPVSQSNTLTAGLELRYDSRDDPASPRSGVLYRSEYRAGTKKTYVGETLRNSVQQVSVDLESYLEFFRRQVILVGFHGRQRTGDRPEASDMYRLGGTLTLRGYREGQFTGTRVGWSNLEYRLLLAARTFVFGFFDAGYYFAPGHEKNALPETEAYKTGYGIGMRVETGVGVLGVSFALGQGDSFSEGKFHVGLLNDF